MGYSRLNVFCNAGRGRNWQTVRLQPVDMKTNGFADLVLNRLYCRSGGNATRQVWYVSRIVAFGLFNHDRITHQRWSLKPACFKMLFKVPGATSSDGLPATVTPPGFLGCLYWRWLPRVATRNQPSASISLITSRTFVPHHRSAQGNRSRHEQQWRHAFGKLTNAGAAAHPGYNSSVRAA